eukprot:768157-Hanusia_phi.AAC.4
MAGRFSEFHERGATHHEAGGMILTIPACLPSSPASSIAIVALAPSAITGHDSIAFSYKELHPTPPPACATLA